jgi:hypothetical protein
LLITMYLWKLPVLLLMGEAITVLNALDTSPVAIGEDVIFFVNDGTNGYLYLLTQVSTAETIAA